MLFVYRAIKCPSKSKVEKANQQHIFTKSQHSFPVSLNFIFLKSVLYSFYLFCLLLLLCHCLEFFSNIAFQPRWIFHLIFCFSFVFCLHIIVWMYLYLYWWKNHVQSDFYFLFSHWVGIHIAILQRRKSNRINSVATNILFFFVHRKEKRKHIQTMVNIINFSIYNDDE